MDRSDEIRIDKLIRERDEARVEVERLTEENGKLIARLRQELTSGRNYVGDVQEMLNHERAEVEQLRAALQAVIDAGRGCE